MPFQRRYVKPDPSTGLLPRATSREGSRQSLDDPARVAQLNLTDLRAHPGRPNALLRLDRSQRPLTAGGQPNEL